MTLRTEDMPILWTVVLTHDPAGDFETPRVLSSNSFGEEKPLVLFDKDEADRHRASYAKNWPDCTYELVEYQAVSE